MQRLDVEGDRLRLQCVLPDPEYSLAGHTRLMLFSRPDGAFVTHGRSEYVVPGDMVAPAAMALLGEGGNLSDFAGFREPNVPGRDLMVCTHGNRDACCGTFGVPLFESLRRQADDGLAAYGTGVRVWRTSHTGGHRFAPTLIDMPDGRYWAYADEGLAKNILKRAGDMGSVMDRYRGWAALDSCAEQAAEKAALARVGWDWVMAEKRVETVAHDNGEAEKEDGGEGRHRVRFEYGDPAGGPTTDFEVSVEYTGSVPTMNCMKEGAKGDNPQYRVLDRAESQ